MMAEALVLALSGTLVGTAWSTFGLYLSSLVYDTNKPAAYTVKGIFLMVAVMFHGLLRSHTPRLFLFVLLLIIVSVVSLTGPAVVVTTSGVTMLLYPIMTAVALLLLVNVVVFPEFSSSFLGIATIETLGETVSALRDAGTYFTAVMNEEEDREPDESQPTTNKNPPTAAEPADKRNVSPPLFRQLIRKMKIGSKPFVTVPDKVNDGGECQGTENGNLTTETEEKKSPSTTSSKTVKLKSLTDRKAKLRAKLASCKAAQTECNFELTFAVLPPRDLKVISDTGMKKLVANAVALIGACESKYALLGDDEDNKSKSKEENKPQQEDAVTKLDFSEPSTPNLSEISGDESNHEEFDRRKAEKRKAKKSRRNKSKTKLARDKEDLELVKPRREIEFGDSDLLVHLVQRVAVPLSNLQGAIDQSVNAISSCLAYCYDVSKLPSGGRPPQGIELQELDIRIDILTSAITEFDRDTSAGLEGAHELRGLEVDIMPRMETFLVSSFLLNLREAAKHTQSMLSHARKLVEKRQARNERRTLYAPKIAWRRWLTSGGENDMLALPEEGRKDARSGTRVENYDDDSQESDSEDGLLDNKTDTEAAADRPVRLKKTDTNPASKSKKTLRQPKARESKRTWLERARNDAADVVEWLLTSEDIQYALKLTFAVFLVTWPAFLAQWNAWYSENRGLWAALQLVLITEVAIGTSVKTFLLRGVGTTIGCLWGYAAYETRNGNRYTCVVLLVIGIIPSSYVHLGSKYTKAGIVSIVSMCIVVAATEDHTVAGTATENYLKRYIAFLIGAVVALLVEVVIFPVKARDRLVESLAASIRQISEMEACLAYGVELETNVDVHSPVVAARFEVARGKAQGALRAAETFLPFCSQEPRLKGSFAGLALVYSEILFVLHQILDRMDNMLQLRREYGSGVLEELNVDVYAYRRNVAGSITLILFAVHEALTTKLALPQFLPSARLAHMRMINRVREVVLMKGGLLGKSPEHIIDHHNDPMRSQIEINMIKKIVRQKYLAWNAASAGQIEVIEYLEELIDLTKLLVGANEFRSGMFTRPSYREYLSTISKGKAASLAGTDEQDENKGSHKTARRDSAEEREREEMKDAVPEPRNIGLKKAATADFEHGVVKRSSTKRSNTIQRLRSFDREKPVEDDDDLPLSLQRVRSRRLEERNERSEKVRSQRSIEESWVSGREGRKLQRVSTEQ